MKAHQRFIAARAAYVVIVLIATMSGLAFDFERHDAIQRLTTMFTPGLGWRDVIDGLRNVALFAGLGVVWVVTSLSGNVARAVRESAFAGLVLSATVEGLQLFSPVRNASIIDVITNTGGAVAGALAIALMIFGVRRARGARSYFGMPASLIALGYGGAVACEALTPLFRPSLFQEYRGSPEQMQQFALQLSRPLSLAQVPWSDLWLYVPAGFLLVLWLNEIGAAEPARLRMLALGAAAASLAAEWLHGWFGMEIRWEAAVLHAVALSSGMWLGARFIPGLSQALRGPARARALILAYMALLVLWGWRPFIPRTSGFDEQLAMSQLVPLASLAQRMDVFSAVHVLQQFVLYLPLGSVLAVWPLRAAGFSSGLWPAVLLAAVIEAGHIVIEQRLFDVTNLLLALAGLAIGWLVIRRSGFSPHGAALAAR